MKRSIATLLSILLLLAGLVGCAAAPAATTAAPTAATAEPAQQTAEQEAPASPTTESGLDYLNLNGTLPIIKEGQNVTIKAICVASKLVDPKNHWIWAFFKQVGNLNIDAKYYDLTGWGEQKNLIFTSGDLPDMFYQCNFSRDEMVTYGQIQGMFYDIKDMIQPYAPLIQEGFLKYPEALASCTTPDGKLYTVPNINNSDEYPKSAPRYFINQAWLTKLGKQNPETLDQLTDVLKAFKTGDPNGNGQNDEIPMISTYENGYFLTASILSALGLNVSETRLPFLKSDGTVGIPFMEAQYADYLKYVKSLLDEELLDLDYFTMTSDQAKAKMAKNIVGVSNMAAPFVEVPDNYQDYVSLNPLTSASSSEKVMPLGDPVTVGQFTISYNSEYPEVCLRFANAHFTKEGPVLYWTGQFEGQPYPILEGWGVTTMEAREGGFGEVVYPTGDQGVWDFLVDHIRPYNGSQPIGYTVYTELCPDLFGMERVMSDVEKTWRDSYTATVQAYGKLSIPNLYYAPEKLERKIALETPITDYLKSMESKFIMGTEPIENLGKFTEQMKSLGIDEYLSIIQEAYDTYKAGLK